MCASGLPIDRKRSSTPDPPDGPSAAALSATKPDILPNQETVRDAGHGSDVPVLGNNESDAPGAAETSVHHGLVARPKLRRICAFDTCRGRWISRRPDRRQVLCRLQNSAVPTHAQVVLHGNRPIDS